MIDKGYTDAKTVSLALKEHQEVFSALTRIDHLFVPGGDLERLTKPGLDELPANQGTANVKESQMYVSPSLIANLQPPVSV
ncbi:MAG: hypothetical protein DFNUSKGM_002857, partial [Candidatus Fervidibacter sacchari]